MEITVETFLKQKPQDKSETVGPTRLSMDDTAYQKLLQLEERLQSIESREMLVDADSVVVDAPAEIGGLEDIKVRVFLDQTAEAAHFHLVAKRSSDDALVYTEPAMLRVVPV